MPGVAAQRDQARRLAALGVFLGAATAAACLVVVALDVSASHAPRGLLLVMLVLGAASAVASVASAITSARAFARLEKESRAAVAAAVTAAVAAARGLGAYRLVERIGSGGMGEVWTAQHQLLVRPAAIKLIRPEVLRRSSPEALDVVRKRFALEAQATASLTSPHTVELYDYGVASDGSFFCVMEFLDGTDLESILVRSGALPVSRVVHLLEQVLHSLRDAHARGVVHRDIKPANVFVCHKGGDWDFVKVLDFGIAKQMQSDARITDDGAVLGTPAYMAPEVIASEPTVDGRADLYSLGCMAYRMLTGHDVFTEKEAISLIAAHLMREPPPLPAEVPPALAAIVMHCLKKSRDERPPTADRVRDALRATGLSREWTNERAVAAWERMPRNAKAPTLERDSGAPSALVVPSSHD